MQGYAAPPGMQGYAPVPPVPDSNDYIAQKATLQVTYDPGVP